jgi:hypothetical protein
MARKLARETYLKPNEILSKVKLETEGGENNNIIQKSEYLKKLVRIERKGEAKNVEDENGITLDFYLTIDRQKFIQKRVFYTKW